ncbi:MAG: hypothetical protein DWQ08_13370 [Proteobacteria bacterium]|nr:MAG: hypothetical protein DWQ08_13370 [Pseudomonadota bacterium]
MTPRKPTDLALILLCGGIALLMPPFALIFNKPVLVLGVPLAALYVFGVWLVLVLGATILGRFLSRGSD